MRKSPCFKNKPCPKRTPGCHGKCKDFKEWRAELDAYNSMVREKKHEEYKLKEAECTRRQRSKRNDRLKG